MNTIMFKDVPVNAEFYAFWNPNNLLMCDTFKAIKLSETTATAKGQFNSVTLSGDEPVIFKDTTEQKYTIAKVFKNRFGHSIRVHPLELEPMTYAESLIIRSKQTEPDTWIILELQ